MDPSAIFVEDFCISAIQLVRLGQPLASPNTVISQIFGALKFR